MREIKYRIDENGCHICTSHNPTKNGYYTSTIGSRKDGTRKNVWIHRYIYEQNNGKIPDGMVVRHKCDNNLCINPGHLETGTPQDNINDKILRGRTIKGESHHNSTLTEEDVEYILINPDSLTAKDLANKFKLHVRQIFRIKSGERWSHVKQRLEQTGRIKNDE